MVSLRVLSKERTLENYNRQLGRGAECGVIYPKMDSLSIFAAKI